MTIAYHLSPGHGPFSHLWPSHKAVAFTDWLLIAFLPGLYSKTTVHVPQLRKLAVNIDS